MGPQTRLGILGPNGVGKSTLLRILAGLDQPDAGRVTRLPSNATVGYLTQEREVVEGETLATYLARRTGVADAETAFNAAAAALGLPGAADGADEAYAAALERYLALGGPDLEARAGAVCAELGLPAALLELAMSQLSGGQAARASLAALLLSRFDIVLLDEPTNDLDFDGLDRLEGFLANRGGGLVVVSHDRAFLERIVTSIGEIDAGSHRLTLFRGGWHAYLEARATAQRHAEEAHVAFTRRTGPPPRPRAPAAAVGRHRSGEGDPEPEGPRQSPTGLPHQSHREAGVQSPLHRTRPRAPRARSDSRTSRGSSISKWLPRRAAATSSPGSRAPWPSVGAGASGRSISSSAGVTGSASWVPTAPARRRCSG